MTVPTREKQPRLQLNTRQDLAARIDETKLTFNRDDDQEHIIRTMCQNARSEKFRAVCVRPEHVKIAKTVLEGTSVLVATVIGFPRQKANIQDQLNSTTFGDFSWEEKVAEMDQARANGADEFDIVMNVREFLALGSKAAEYPGQFEIAQLVAHCHGLPIKLIIETDLLSDESIVQATLAAIHAGIDFVKTSTGMLEGGKGATPKNISLIYQTIREANATRKPGIKASGGIRTAKQAFTLLENGADILGSSAGSVLLDEFEAENHVTFNR